MAQRTDVFIASRDDVSIWVFSSPVDTSVERLLSSIDTGRVHLAFDSTRGHLHALLNALSVLPESQSLVFSETSAQHS